MQMFGQDQANKQNRNLNIQNRAWLENMENTAVRRRMTDLKAAGLNPALAAAGGGAGTPSTSPAEMKSTTEDAGKSVGEAASTAIQASQAKANIAFTQASTAKELALARDANVNADIREQLKTQERDEKLNRYVESYEWHDLETKTRRVDLQIREITRDMSAAELNQFQRTRNALEETIKQQAREGRIQLDALERIASVYGLEAGKAKDLLRLLIDIYSAQKTPRK